MGGTDPEILSSLASASRPSRQAVRSGGACANRRGVGRRGARGHSAGGSSKESTPIGRSRRRAGRSRSPRRRNRPGQTDCREAAEACYGAAGYEAGASDALAGPRRGIPGRAAGGGSERGGEGEGESARLVVRAVHRGEQGRAGGGFGVRCPYPGSPVKPASTRGTAFASAPSQENLATSNAAPPSDSRGVARHGRIQSGARAPPDTALQSRPPVQLHGQPCQRRHFVPHSKQADTIPLCSRTSPTF